jgi:uncharacterized protein (DUF2237 family)
MTQHDPRRRPPRNVLGGALQPCSLDPVTGFYRNGCCETGPEDRGLHVVCAQVTEAFLAFSAERGNDLTTPIPDFRFPGLKPGDRWCLCALRWLEAAQAGVAPPVILSATHEATLALIPKGMLLDHAVPEARHSQEKRREPGSPDAGQAPSP